MDQREREREIERQRERERKRTRMEKVNSSGHLNRKMNMEIEGRLLLVLLLFRRPQ